MNNLRSLLAENRPLTVAAFGRPSTPEQLQFYQDAGLDIVEFRADLNQSSTLATAQATLESYSALPTILTIRTKNEGGAWRFDEATRFKWFSALAPQANGVDVELNSPCARAVAALAQKHGKTLILSCHFFTVPWNLTTLRQQAGRAAALGADIFKFAATAERPPELALLREFLMYWNRGRPRGRKLVLAPMGAGAAVPHARLAFARAARSLIYVRGARSTAAGQPTLPQAVNFLKTRT